jgi:tetratricopeptide (TPR) repeat protein
MAESFVWTGHFGEAEEIAQRGLSHLRSTGNSYRAHLLGLLGYIRSVRGEFSCAMEAFDEALGSPAVTPFLIGRVLTYRSFHHFHLLKVDKALEDSRKSAALSNAQDSPWTYAAALSVAMCSLYYLGKPDQALKIAIELEPLAKRLAQLGALSSCVIIQAWAEFGREPNLTILDSRICDAVNLNRETQLSWFLPQSLAMLSLVRFLAGDWDSARSLAEEARATEPGVVAGPSASMLLHLTAYSGDRDRVLELAEQTRSQLPMPGQANTIGAWSLLMGTVEALAMLRERGSAAELYPRLRELLGCGAVSIAFLCRFPETVAGIAASAAGDWNAAELHFEAALRQAMEFPHQLEEAEVRRFHAMMLLDRAAPGDREMARTLLGQAFESYKHIGMRRHVELTQALIAQAVC